jgi:hypothetical protein
MTNMIPERTCSKKNAVFSDGTLCGSCKNRGFGGTYHLHRQGEKNPLVRITLAVTKN